jgi:hypothetical protein
LGEGASVTVKMDDWSVEEILLLGDGEETVLARSPSGVRRVVKSYDLVPGARPEALKTENLIHHAFASRPSPLILMQPARSNDKKMVMESAPLPETVSSLDRLLRDKSLRLGTRAGRSSLERALGRALSLVHRQGISLNTLTPSHVLVDRRDGSALFVEDGASWLNQQQMRCSQAQRQMRNMQAADREKARTLLRPPS